jgi:YfiH family protein
VYQIPQLLEYKNLFHVFSEKSEGNMANVINGKIYNSTRVLINRKCFFKRVGVNINKTVCMWVTHGEKLVEADPMFAGISMLDYKKAVKVDGLVTSKKGLYLFLLIADCLPLIIYDPEKEAVGLIHIGWKGVDLEIAKKAVKYMNNNYNSDPNDLIVGIGPCVHKESFIKKDPMQKDDPRWKKFIRHIECDKYSVDLVSFAIKQLVDLGVSKDKIFESGVDTVKDEKFYSHVRDTNRHISRQGRFACIAGIR